MPRGYKSGDNWVVDDGGCWIWQGPLSPAGYGPMKSVYERLVGPKPPGHDLHHICRKGASGCVNPGHMELMTTSAHRRMHAHERGKITLEQAREIRELLLDQSLPTWKIAEPYGITRFVVERIGAGTYWPDAGGTPLEYTVICPYCGATVVSTSRRRRYCSTEHRVLMGNTMQTRWIRAALR